MAALAAGWRSKRHGRGLRAEAAEGRCYFISSRPGECRAEYLYLLGMGRGVILDRGPPEVDQISQQVV